MKILSKIKINMWLRHMELWWDQANQAGNFNLEKPRIMSNVLRNVAMIDL